MTLYLYARNTNQDVDYKNNFGNDCIGSALNSDCQQIGIEVYLTDLEKLESELMRVNGKLYKKLGYDKFKILGDVPREYAINKIKSLNPKKKRG